MSADLQPLAVYDVYEGGYRYEGFEEFRSWVTAHGIDVNATHRIEIHLLDAPFARVFQHDQRPGGGAYVDPETGDIAQREPFDVLISSPPPIDPAPVF